MNRRQQIAQLRREFVELDAGVRADGMTSCALHEAALMVTLAGVKSGNVAQAKRDSDSLCDQASDYGRDCERKVEECKEITRQIDRLEYECTWTYAWRWLWRAAR